MTVFAVQQPHRWNGKKLVPTFDLRPAEEYGEIEFLLSPSAAPWDTVSIVDELQEKLHNYTDEDYLLLIGNPVLIGLTVAIAANMNGAVNCLQWSGKDKKYICVSANI